MRALAIILALFSGSAAFATSELSLKSSMPIVLWIDGESQGTVQPLEALIIDLEPGVHRLQLRGMMGKDHYDRELIFDDDTRTELQWQRKELRLGQVVQLDPDRGPDDDEDEYVDDTPPEAPPVPERPEVEEIDLAPEPAEEEPTPVLARPEAPPPTPASTAPAPAPAQAQKSKARKVRTPDMARSGSVVIEATEGLDLQIAHGGQMLRVTVDDGELVITDPHGTEIRFPAQNDAW